MLTAGKGHAQEQIDAQNLPSCNNLFEGICWCLIQNNPPAAGKYVSSCSKNTHEFRVML